MIHSCDFCEKTTENVPIMIKSVNKSGQLHFICNECVQNCMQIVVRNIDMKSYEGK